MNLIKAVIRRFKTIDELNAAHDAQNEVLRQKQAEIRRLQAELDSTRAWFMDVQREFEKELAAVRAECDAVNLQIERLTVALLKRQAVED